MQVVWVDFVKWKRIADPRRFPRMRSHHQIVTGRIPHYALPHQDTLSFQNYNTRPLDLALVKRH